MKKNLLLVFTILYSVFSYCQFSQNFEAPAVTVPKGFPPGWLATNNGVGTLANWEITDNVSAVISGTKSCYINRHEIGSGNTSEDWLIMPLIAIPANGQLKFTTKQALAGNQGTIYQIRVYSGNSQSNLSSYTVIKQWTETQLNQTFNVAEEQKVDFLNASFGTNVNVAFVRVYTQPTATLGGDRWIIDDIGILEKCSSPLGLSASNVTATSAQILWNAPFSSVGYELEIVPASSQPTGVPTYTSATTNFTITGLNQNTTYKVFLRTKCSTTNYSDWVGPYQFQTFSFGHNCSNPIVVAALPYSSTNNAGNFGNTLEGPQSSSCIDGTTNYQAGRAVFYSYTATENCTISFTSTSINSGSSLFLYQHCAEITGPCLAAVGNNSNNPRILNYTVTAGTTYIIVIASNSLSQNIGYDLLIQGEMCTNKPTNLCATPIGLTAANLGWTAPEDELPLGYQVAVQVAGSPIPSGPGPYLVNDSNFVVSALTPEIPYQYWVQSECALGVFSAWEGPKLFMITTCPMPQDWNQSVMLSTFAKLNWSQPESADQWEVFVSVNGVVPVNGSPLNVGIPSYYIANTNMNFLVNGLAPGTNYAFYVRNICSSTTFSNWLLLNVIPQQKVELVAFLDTNNNGIKEVSENNFQKGTFTFIKNNVGPINYVSSQFGSYTIDDINPANTYNFNYEIDTEYAGYYAETPTNFDTVSMGIGPQILYFPITNTQTYADVDVSITALNVPRPGFAYTHKIIYRNQGNQPASGLINYTKNNSNVSITLVSPSATTTNSTGFTYEYSNLLAGETRYILVNMLVATIPTVNLGDIITNSVSISLNTDDINTTNNTFSTSETVVGSYNPNDKNEAHGPNVPIGQFSQSDYLFYTIRFQNTGTANAETVRIEDVLGSQFNLASLRTLSASHNYSLERRNNKLTWTFNGINLPGALQNESESHGYVTFKIKLNPGFVVGNVIENTAQIYFDFNPAIITNTFQTTFVPNLSVGSFNANNLAIYPNPVKESVTVQLKNSTEMLQKIVIYDFIGKTVRIFPGNATQQMNVNTDNLSKGVYILEIATNSNVKQNRKIIVH